MKLFELSKGNKRTDGRAQGKHLALEAKRIAVVTGVDSKYEPIAALSDPSKDAYCDRGAIQESS